MPRVQIHNLDRPLKHCLKVHYCERFLCRLRGLMFHPPLDREDGLVLVGARQNRRDAAIHMFFMRFAIDVIFIDKNSRIVGLVKSIKPFRMSPYFFKACSAIELAAGTIEKTETSIGDEVLFEE